MVINVVTDPAAVKEANDIADRFVILSKIEILRLIRQGKCDSESLCLVTSGILNTLTDLVRRVWLLNGTDMSEAEYEALSQEIQNCINTRIIALDTKQSGSDN